MQLKQLNVERRDSNQEKKRKMRNLPWELSTSNGHKIIFPKCA